MPSDKGNLHKEHIRTGDTLGQSVVTDAGKNDLLSLLDNQTLRTSPFGGNISAEQVYRRAERIASAIHLITGHIGHDEPARDAARSESINLLNLALMLRSELRATGSENVRKMQACIRKLISLLRILGISGRMSLQNTHVLVDALDELGNLLITSQRSALAESVPLSREDLTPHGHRADQGARQRTLSASRRGGGDRAGITSTSSGISTKDNIKRGEAVSGSRTSRIMDILRDGGLLGIKDISSNLPEYSEKMIQRDLALLVRQNQVRKTGAKRWSKYAIVQ